MSALTRRAWLAGAGAAGALVALGGPAAPRAAARARPPAAPFTLGVASGDPVADGFVIWTRLAPEPLDVGGGLPPAPMPVRWEVAEDERMNRVVRRGTATARPEWAHSVHVEVAGLAPDRWYWYRFGALGEARPVGRARTTPALGAPLARLRLAYASCQHWEHGYFAAYRHMLADDLDLVVHLGDYIYEYSGGAVEVRRHDGPKPTTLAGYRARHALYKTDPDLRAAHAAYPWVVTWDDHEVENDYAGDRSQDREDPRTFRARRLAAYQAYWEHMPLRHLARPRGGDMRLYGRLAFGDLLEMSVLDGRQHRSAHACSEGPRGGGRLVEASCAERLDPARTMLGAEQEAWLLRGLAGSAARWNVIAQAQLMAELRQRNRAGAVGWWTDAWDGYPAARARILRHLQERKVANPVVIGGDIHSFWVTDLKPDFAVEAAPAVATEIVGTSVTSPGVPYEMFAAFLPDNPHVRFFESRRRGYVRCTVTPARWQAELRALADVRDPGTAAETLATFVIEAGRPGAQRA